MSKTFKVNRFNKEIEKVTKGMSKQAKANVRVVMLYRCLKHSIRKAV